MEQTVQEDLFEIKLNASGILYIRKFAVAAKMVIITGIAISLIYITGTIIRTIKFDPALYKGETLFLFQQRIWPFYTAVYSIFFFLQLYYYHKLSNYLRKGIDYNDDEMFNKSFNALYRYATTGIIIFVVVLLMNLFDLYLTIKYYMN